MSGGTTRKFLKALAPAEEGVTLAVAAELQLGVGLEGEPRARLVDLDRVVDDQLDRLEGVDLLGVASHPPHRVAHRRQVDHGGHAGEVLEQHPARLERDLARRDRLGIPVRQPRDVGGRHRVAVLAPQQVLEEDFERKGKSRHIEPRRLQDIELVNFIRLAVDRKRGASLEAVRHGRSRRDEASVLNGSLRAGRCVGLEAPGPSQIRAIDGPRRARPSLWGETLDQHVSSATRRWFRVSPFSSSTIRGSTQRGNGRFGPLVPQPDRADTFSSRDRGHCSPSDPRRPADRMSRGEPVGPVPPPRPRGPRPRDLELPDSSRSSPIGAVDGRLARGRDSGQEGFAALAIRRNQLSTSEVVNCSSTTSSAFIPSKQRPPWRMRS